jgi:hypothetical protein
MKTLQQKAIIREMMAYYYVKFDPASLGPHYRRARRNMQPNLPIVLARAVDRRIACIPGGIGWRASAR